MKFLHLSDLHIGKTVNGFSMINEQRHVFKQIIGYIETETPDAVVIAGDIYDRAVPAIDAVRLFDDFLTDLAEKNITVLIISGNHDSPDRLNYASRLLLDRQLHICGTLEGGMRSVTLNDKYGEVDFWLLPFIKPSGVRGLFSDREIDSYSDAVSAVIAGADIDCSKRNVIVSHQFYTASGVTPIRSESEINPIGGLDAVDAGVLSCFDYAALGHLHGQQNVGENARYSGSPLKYSFSECRQKKSVTLVELKEKGDISIKMLPLVPIHDMREIKGPIEELLSGSLAFQGDKEDYLRVTLTDENEIIDPMGKIRSVYPNVMALDFENSSLGCDTAVMFADIEQMERVSSFDLFSQFFLETNGSTMNEKQSKIVLELLETGVE